MTLDLRADLAADLLRDLEEPGRTSAPAGPSTGPARPSTGPAVPLTRRTGTPALSLTLTPLRWSWPVLRRVRSGAGVVAALGPWRVELSADARTRPDARS